MAKKNNQLKLKYALISIWVIIFIIYFIQIINQDANQWWYPWIWEVVSLLNVFVLFCDIKKHRKSIDQE